MPATSELRFRSTAALLIVAALAACDNVRWGGADFQIVPPPPAAGTQSALPSTQTFADLGLPSGTVLFHVVKTSGGAGRLLPVAELSGDSLRALRRPAGVSPQAYDQRFREAVFARGAEFALFRRGAEVGTLTVQGDGPPTACGVPTATGTITTVAAAADAPEFLAFRRGLAPKAPGSYSPPPMTGSIQTFASIVAERLVLQNGLPRPRSWPGAQRDVQPLEVGGAATPEMAATYLVGDSLGVGPANPQGWSVFYLASYETRSGYTPFYTEVRDYRRMPKAAPKVVDYLNWDGRGGTDILIQVFGARERWYEVVSSDGRGKWSKVWAAQPCRGEAAR